MSVHAVDNPLRIRVVSSAGMARRLLRGGYCPVECGFGSESVVCRLRMDHHGPLHELPGVARRAYVECFGARARRPWFAVTGHADEDATWAIGSLAGLLPHPSRARQFGRAPEAMRRVWTRDWAALADLINRVDTDPAPLDLESSRHGRLLLLWRLRGSFPMRDSLAFYAGIDRWRTLLTQATERELDLVPRLLEARLEQIRGLSTERFGRHVALVDSSIWGFATVYAWSWFRSLGVSVLFVFQPQLSGRGVMTVCARDRPTAERLYGAGGLLHVFSKLEPSGWGGRPVIGGSNRSIALSWEQARKAASQAARLVIG